MTDIPDEIRVSDDGTTVPVIELLTGRGFVTGKSGSGKSNTASVIAEELLELDLPMLIVDTDGEYYGLKERYELLHVGAGDLCDVQVTPTHAERIATLALEENVPVILDVSEYLDVDDARELIHGVVKTLFVREKKEKKPFLLLVEECHEYLPESGALDEVGEVLLQVAKRGRKRGLGLCGISQRPAAVDKDFITQCDWLVWHRLTWENDTKVVGRFLDDEYAEAVEELDNGEAIVVTDWDEKVSRFQFRRKKTFDAGATPGLEDVERPDFRTISADLEAELAAIDPTVNAEAGTSAIDEADASADLDDVADDAGADSVDDDGIEDVGIEDIGIEGVDDARESDDATADPAEAGSGGGSQSGGSAGSGSASARSAALASTASASSRATESRGRRAATRRTPPPPPPRPSMPGTRRRRRRRGRDAAEENIVLEASHLVAYGVESTVWRIRLAVHRARWTARRSYARVRRRLRRRTRRAGANLGVDPRLIVALVLGVTTLAVGLALLTVVR